MNEAAAIVWLSAMWVMLSDNPNEVYMGNSSYYDKLMQQCEHRAGRACCRASVRAMKKTGGTLTNIKQGCPDTSKLTSLRCPATAIWCEPQNNTRSVQRDVLWPEQ